MKRHTLSSPGGSSCNEKRTQTGLGDSGGRKSNSSTFVSLSIKMGNDNYLYLMGLLGGLNERGFVNCLMKAYKIDPQ